MPSTIVKCDKKSCEHNYYGNCRKKMVNITSQRKCDSYKVVPEKAGLEAKEGESNGNK